MGPAEGAGAAPAPTGLAALATGLDGEGTEGTPWSREDLDQLLAPLTDTLVLVSRSGTISYMSAGVRRLLGYDPRSLVGQFVLDLVHPDDARGNLGVLIELGSDADDLGTTGRLIRLRHAEGHWCDVLAVSGPAHGSRSWAHLSVLLRPAGDGTPTVDELGHRLAFEDLLTEIAATFIHSPSHEVDQRIDEVLALIGRFAAVDRCSVHLLQASRAIAEVTHEWCAPGVAPRSESASQVPLVSIPRWAEAMRQQEPVFIPRVSDLGAAWSGERSLLERTGTRASLASPICDSDQLIGFISFDLVSSERLWSDDHLGVLTSAAGLISQSLSRRDAEQRFAMAFDRAPLGMALHGPDGRHVQVNPAFCALIGRPEGELIGESVLDLVCDDDREELVVHHRRILDGDTDQISMALRFVGSGGRTFWCRIHSAAVREPDRSLRYTVSHVEDITALRESEQELARQALHEPLTGLANRVLLDDFLTRSLQRDGAPEPGIAVLFIDLDRFKVVNDSLGHRAGDELLVGTARRIEALVRPTDLVARLGGDEFVVVIDSFEDRRDPVRIAARIRDELTDPMVIDGTEVVTTGSIGIAIASAGDDADRLLRDADAAMYLAKTNGRNRYEVFDASLRS